MKTSVIRFRVADFLRQYPPFSELTEEDLLSLAAGGRVIFHESEEYLFRQHQPLGPALWVIQQGSVEILDETPRGDELRDMLAEGDILGGERVSGSTVYAYSARTASDVILYSIDAASVEKMAAHNPGIARYLAAQFSIAERNGVEARRANVLLWTTWLEAPGPSDNLLRGRRLVASPKMPVHEAAEIMSHNNRDWVAVVDVSGAPLGLVTDRELRNRVATGYVSHNSPIEAIMNARVPAVPPGLGSAAYLVTMMHNRCRELNITADGSPNARLEGVVTDSDLSLLTGVNPVLLLLQVVEATTVDDWKRILEQAEGIVADGLAHPSNVDLSAMVASAFLNATAEAMIRRAQTELEAAGRPAPPIPYCWLLFGRTARGEALLPMQPEIGVVYDDSSSPVGSVAQEYFSAVLEKTIAYFTSCGLSASIGLTAEIKSLRCQSLAAWKDFFNACIANPIGNAIYQTRTLFDFQPLLGERSLGRDLKKTIGLALQQSDSFIPILANDTLSNLPPLTFFRGLVVELDGVQRDTLDVETTALDPIADAARVFALATQNLEITNTLERLHCAADAMPESRVIFQEAAQAFRVAAYQQALAGFRGEGKSAVIRPSALGKYDQRMLKAAFDSIQRLLELSSKIFENAA
jgi:CBS domain-containing protein